ncbi:unnamed protein product [Kuraishia capsulata CBS 1993]|uniref:cysteine--tRNA ligase n=1 Tax=Kuraishia capsulata CBS 1993 TaxID=1382522 RepID=W6MX05_9ASCO|nr:uncharacterized protein KUCA_T00004041001 [Kuraishia capsulata CBS 1993]CDK28060.1 unnamed protein product [Kuraishia capsulata CBS 1993]
MLRSFIRKMSSSISQPTWVQPVTANKDLQSTLKLYNSLTRAKVPFIPKDVNEVTWYSCGPTVYDSSHMGHARNYVTIDINRRILQDYFGYNVTFVQNVTDIDDKIIIKGRHEYLFQQFSSSHTEIDSELVSEARESWTSYVQKNLPGYDFAVGFPEWTKTLDLSKAAQENPKTPMYVKAASAALVQINAPTTIEEFLAATKDVIVPSLDKKFGSTVTDPEVFRKLSAFWENEYNKDMAKLNVIPPTVTTRVSEYVPEIVEFVSKIINSGYAYSTSDGSVYFNTAKFDKAPNHDYAKLQPWNKGDLDLIEDGEGSLSLSTQGKISPADFALWKSSKPGEPSWDSPWGQGRPGWHIECSVMASDFVGETMDIHSGGIDLAFPHHDNELAQSEACFDCKQWVNYFLHTGHLHIEGQKMSKSLKNFITIEEALNKYSARQLRLCFALVQWNNQLDFKESLLNEVKAIESTLSKFFQNVRALNSDYTHMVSEGQIISKKLGLKERELLTELQKTRVAVNSAFCDNLSTPVALRSLLELVQSVNNYIQSAGVELRIEPIIQAANYITRILGVVGFQSRSDSLGWEDSSSTGSEGSREEVAMPFVKVLSTFRDLVRSSAIEKQDYKVFLDATDRIRDKDLLDLGVALDDRNNQAALIKFLSAQEQEELTKQQEEKEKIAQAKLAKKVEQLKLKEQQQKQRMEKAKQVPSEMFKTGEYQGLYSEWDSEGLPVKAADGTEVTKSARKKLVKLFEQQKKLHEEYLSLQD